MSGSSYSTIEGVREKTKRDFIVYLMEHPEERFWQAVRNFSGVPYLLASDDPVRGEEHLVRDTFYWEDKDGKTIRPTP